MRKNILFVLSFLITALVSAQDISEVSTPATADVPTVSNDIPTITVVEAPQFGFLSYNNVLKAMPEYEQAQQSIEKLKTYYDKEMERSEKEFSKKFNEFIDGYKSFPENIMLKRQKELQQLMEESMTFKKEAQQLLTKSEKELMEPIHTRLKEAIQTIGKERNYSYIINTDNNNYPFININKGEDITDAVIKLVK